MNNYDKFTIKHALQLSAPYSWVASIIPAFFGLLYCKLHSYYLTPLQAILLVVLCIFMQVSVNAFNDYVDFIKGRDTKEDDVEASDAVLVYNNIDPKHAFNMGVIALILACLLGVIACYKSGYPPFVVGLIGVITVIMYSHTNHSISSLPLGEFVSGFIMGSLIPLGIVATATGAFHLEVIIYSLPLLLGIGLIMMTNNGCDIEKDIRGGRFTLPARIGRGKSIKLYRFFILLWIISLVGLSILQLGSVGYLILPALIVATKPFHYILTSQLEPNKRILQMKAIVMANILGNGAYLLVFIIKIIVR